MSTRYLPQYLPDSFNFYTSYQLTSVSVSWVPKFECCRSFLLQAVVPNIWPWPIQPWWLHPWLWISYSFHQARGILCYFVVSLILIWLALFWFSSSTLHYIFHWVAIVIHILDTHQLSSMWHSSTVTESNSFWKSYQEAVFPFFSLKEWFSMGKYQVVSPLMTSLIVTWHSSPSFRGHNTVLRQSTAW